MKRTLTVVSAWFQKAYNVLKRLEEAADYRYEDHAEERFKKLEHRLAALENQPGK